MSEIPTGDAFNHNDLNDLQRRVGEWGSVTFPKANDYTISAHLRDEVKELIYEINEVEELVDAECIADPREIEKEAADCLLLLLHLAHRNGFSLVEAARKKFSVNQKRSWNTDSGNGYVKHDVEA